MTRSHVTSDRLSRAAPVFTALGDETRLYLVSRLCEEGPLSISQLTAETALTRQAVTKHLHVLADAGLARAERSGRQQLWTIHAKRLGEVRRLLSQISAQWENALERLRRFVEVDES